MFEELGSRASMTDTAKYLYHIEYGEVHGMVLNHVVDLLPSSGCLIFEASVMEALKTKLSLGNYENFPFNNVGMRMHQKKGEISVSQNYYVEMAEISSMENEVDS